MIGALFSALRVRLFGTKRHPDAVTCDRCRGRGKAMYLQCHVRDDEYFDDCHVCDGMGWHMPIEVDDEQG